jgi:hypothetical protein
MVQALFVAVLLLQQQEVQAEQFISREPLPVALLQLRLHPLKLLLHQAPIISDPVPAQIAGALKEV